MLRETVKAGFFCDFSSFSRCGKDCGVGTTPPCGHPSRGGEFTLVSLRGEFLLDGLRGEFTLVGLRGEFSVDVVLCVDFMAYCCGVRIINPHYRTRRNICTIAEENTKKPSRNYPKKKRTLNPLAILSQNFTITP